MNIIFCFVSDMWNTFVVFLLWFFLNAQWDYVIESIGYRVKAWSETRFEILERIA